MNAAAPFSGPVAIPIGAVAAAALACLILTILLRPHGRHSADRAPLHRRILAAAEWHARDWAWRPVLWWRVLVINRAVRQLRKEGGPSWTSRFTTAASTVSMIPALRTTWTIASRAGARKGLTPTERLRTRLLAWPAGQMPRPEMLPQTLRSRADPEPEEVPAPVPPLRGRAPAQPGSYPYPALAAPTAPQPALTEPLNPARPYVKAVTR